MDPHDVGDSTCGTNTFLWYFYLHIVRRVVTLLLLYHHHMSMIDLRSITHHILFIFRLPRTLIEQVQK